MCWFSGSAGCVCVFDVTLCCLSYPACLDNRNLRHERLPFSAVSSVPRGILVPRRYALSLAFFVTVKKDLVRHASVSIHFCFKPLIITNPGTSRCRSAWPSSVRRARTAAGHPGGCQRDHEDRLDLPSNNPPCGDNHAAACRTRHHQSLKAVPEIVQKPTNIVCADPRS